MTKKPKPRSSSALPAKMRKAGPMKDKRLKRVDENKNPDFLDEMIEEFTEEDPDFPKLLSDAKDRTVIKTVLYDTNLTLRSCINLRASLDLRDDVSEDMRRDLGVVKHFLDQFAVALTYIENQYCRTCGGAYIKNQINNVCSSAFHCCRDCMWKDGKRTKICKECQAWEKSVKKEWEQKK